MPPSATRACTPRGMECPNDGTLLEITRTGQLHCRFDGWIGRPDEAAPRGRRAGAFDLYTANYDASW